MEHVAGHRIAVRAVALLLFAMSVAATSALSDTLAIVSGDNQTVARAGTEVPGGIAKFKPLSVSLTDNAGKPVSGATVNFVCEAPSAMACQLDPGGGGVAATTDTRGVATLNRMGGNSVSVYYASGDFQVTAAADNAPAVTFHLKALDAPPPPPPIASAIMSVVAGDKQTAARMPTSSGIAVAKFDPLQVRVTANGKPLAGVEVTWTCEHPAQMACQSEPSGASPTVTLTDGNGVATLNKMDGKSVDIYYADGTVTMTASYGKASARFQLTATPAAKAERTLTITAGNNQSVQRSGLQIPGGIATFKPLAVDLRNRSGEPISGATVDFVCKAPSAMACQLDPSGSGSVEATTDANGTATLNRMGGSSVSVYYASGKFQVTAAADGAEPVAFDLQALDAPAPPPPVADASMAIVSGNNQKVARTPTSSGIDTASFNALKVEVTAAGKPLSGVQVTWTCAHPAQMACQSEPSGASPTVTVTDENGVATLNKMEGKSVSAYYADGAITMTASYGKASAQFHLTVGQ